MREWRNLVDALDLGSSTGKVSGFESPFSHQNYTKTEVLLETKINIISTSEHELEVNLGYDEIQPEINLAYQKESKKIEMPGFRKGKVPLSMVKKVYGDAIEYKASEEIANK